MEPNKKIQVAASHFKPALKFNTFQESHLNLNIKMGSEPNLLDLDILSKL